MPVTRDDAEMLAQITKHARPHGAPQWDGPGILSAIGQVKHLELPEVMKACARAAQDRTLRTPAAIGDVRSSAWRERLTELTTPTKPRICPTHDTQYHGPTCPSCRADQLEGCAPRPRTGGRTPEAIKAITNDLRTRLRNPEEPTP